MSYEAEGLILGDCRVLLRDFPENSIDACVTDPPYGIGFMGKEWDTFKPGVETARVVRNAQHTSDNPNLKGRSRGPASSPSAVEYDRTLTGQRAFQEWCESWAREVCRVLKPGAHLVVFGAPRAHHRMMSGLEDAGFEIRDCLAWLFGQGFPKSLNLHGEWEGWGTAIKPAFEPIALARKPFKGSLTANVAQWGTGALNIDGCRIVAPKGDRTEYGLDGDESAGRNRNVYSPHDAPRTPYERPAAGRWPAAVTLDEDAAAMLDAQSGQSVSRKGRPRTGVPGSGWGMTHTGTEYSDVGGASRFFYCPKVSRAEREFGCEHLPARTPGEMTGGRAEGSAGLDNPRAGAGRTSGSHNAHPTVKPIALMRWLVRLVTPPGGLILDPFVGSGPTGIAAEAEAFSFVGMDEEVEWLTVAAARMRAWRERGAA